MCSHCAEMPEFCKSPTQCNFCFLSYPEPGGLQSCSEVSNGAACDEACSDYRACGRGCVPKTCNGQNCAAIRANECEDECPAALCRPYQTNGDPATVACPADCADTCSFSEFDYEICPLCWQMPEFCKSRFECDLCFVKEPAPGDRRTCNGMEDGDECDATCKPTYELCTRGCIPPEPPPSPPSHDDDDDDIEPTHPPYLPPISPPDAPPTPPLPEEGAQARADGLPTPIARMFASAVRPSTTGRRALRRVHACA